MNILSNFWQAFIPCILAIAGASGVLALASPRAFAAVASYSSRLVNGSKTEHGIAKWVDVDQFVLQHARLFGFLVTASVVYLGYLIGNQDAASSNSFLVIIVGVSLGMGILSLAQMSIQKHLIASHLEQAHTDSVTGLANRRAFDIELARGITQRQRCGTSISLLLLDIDKFKQVNDNHGHQVGDEILKEICGQLTAASPTGAMAARLGGDEFGVILAGTDLKEASLIAEDVRQAIGKKPLSLGGEQHVITMSIGISEAQVDNTAAELIRRADSALYAAKEAGRNCCYRESSPEPAVPAVDTV